MKKRNGEFRCVYAGPEFFARQNGQAPDDNEPSGVESGDNTQAGEQQSENAPPSYPDSFKEGGEEPNGSEPPIEAGRRRGTMRILYAGPELQKKNNMRRDGPLMQAVYACPPMPPVSDEPQMMCVYAGPEMMSGKLRPKDLPGQFVKNPDDAAMNEVYGGPDMTGAELDVREQLICCPSCGCECNASANFCQSCGEKLVKPRFCAACGNSLDEAANFCPNCGAPASREGAEPPKKQTLRKGFFARPKGSRDELV